MPSRRPRSATRSRGQGSATNGVEDGAAGEHEIGAFGADAGIGRAFVKTHRHELADHTGNLLVRQPATVNPPPIVAPQPQIHAGNRGHGPRRAEHVEAVEIAVIVGEFVDESGDIFDHGVVDLARNDFAAISLGERNDADRQRCPTDDVGRGRTAGGLRRSTA